MSCTLVICLHLAAALLPAQVSGIVVDPAGLAVSGASVELHNQATGLIRRTQTGPGGEYHFLAVPPGPYSLQAAMTGFAPLTREGLAVHLGQAVRVDLRLPLGTQDHSVVVHADVPLLESSRGTVSFSLHHRKLSTLPLDGRNFVPLVALSPGVNLPPGSAFPRINGSRPRTSEHLYDGISVLQPEPGQVAYYPVIDAMEEFRVETNSYSAEYGRSNGGIILVSHKSGGNQWRGSLFEFFRHETLNARNLFAQQGSKPVFRRNQYGAAAGGPIRRDRAFLFGEWQATRQRTGVVRTSTVPLQAEREGLFAVPVFDPSTARRDPFPGNWIPAHRVDAAARIGLARYPLPNLPGAANNFRRVGKETVDQDQFGLRVDHYLSSAQRLFARWTRLRDQTRPVAPLPDGSGEIPSGVTGHTWTRGGTIMADHSWTLSPSWVNQVRLGQTWRGFDRESLRTGGSASELSGVRGLPPNAFGDVLPTYDIAGLEWIGPPPNANARFTTRVTQVVEQVAWVRGGHSRKAGADLRWQGMDALQPASPTGLFRFSGTLTGRVSADGAPVAGTGNSLASFLLGQVEGFQIDLQDEVLKPRASAAEFYLQDDWRVNARLSLNLGMRYTLNFPSTVEDARSAVFDLHEERLRFGGAARALRKDNLGPRAGLAWTPAPGLALRAGYGVTWFEQSGITTPFTTPLFPFVRTLTQLSLDNLTPAFHLSAGQAVSPGLPGPDAGLGQGVFAVQREQNSGYAQQWNLSIQKTRGKSSLWEAGYLGSKLTNLGVPDVNLNQLRVEQLAGGVGLTRAVPNPYFGLIPAGSSLAGPTWAAQQLLRPYPRFTTVALYRNNVGHSSYHSLQARWLRRHSSGLSFSLAYTFSKLIDDAGAVFDAALLTGPAATFQAADSHNRRLEKDASTGDMRHVFSSGFVFDLPPRPRWKGWQVAGLARAQSGRPLTISQIPHLNGFAGFGMQRPDRLRDPRLPEGRGVDRWFDVAAFQPAGSFSLGSSSRNPVRGPGYVAIDLMVSRTWKPTEHLRAELRMEAFNLSNTPPLANPNASLGTPAFGSIRAGLDGRVFEIVGKLHF
ncbi:MAG: carboxypeptidase regulatory-like domain-containing protein [Acidimicrobiia bacterium]|nr:carboxypeptidase regulatory-like domain-containing protein [Acidimicrobiia bacterium]